MSLIEKQEFINACEVLDGKLHDIQDIKSVDLYLIEDIAYIFYDRRAVYSIGRTYHNRNDVFSELVSEVGQEIGNSRWLDRYLPTMKEINVGIPDYSQFTDKDLSSLFTLNKQMTKLNIYVSTPILLMYYTIMRVVELENDKTLEVFKDRLSNLEIQKEELIENVNLFRNFYPNGKEDLIERIEHVYSKVS